MITRSWGGSVIEPMPLYPHAVEFCRHYGKWWCRDARSRYALVICVPEGVLRYSFDGRSINISGNNVLVIPPGTKFYFENDDDTVYQKNVLYLLGLNIRDILEVLGLKKLQLIRLPGLDYMLNSFRAIYSCLDRKTPQSMAEACGTSYAVLNYLSNHVRAIDTPPALFNVLKSHLSSDFDSRMDLESISAKYGISSKSITRMFKKHLNMTPGEYRNAARNEAAKRLLQTTGLSVKEIAEKLGYSNQFHFSNFFKRINGVPPRMFREKLLNKN